jgi:hypothetical protein
LEKTRKNLSFYVFSKFGNHRAKNTHLLLLQSEEFEVPYSSFYQKICQPDVLSEINGL